jgi:hypothetical protein
MMNPKLLKAVLSCLIIAVSASVLMAQEIERRAQIANFNAISVSSGIDLYLTQSNTEQIVLKGSKNLVDKVKVSKSDNGILTFKIEKTGWGNWSWGKEDDVKAYVSFKTLKALMASGGSDVFSEGQLNLNDLSIKSSGGSDLMLNLIVNDLNVVSSGGSDVYLKGKATKFTLQASGGSDIKAFGLIAEDVVSATSGGSDAELYATKTIKIAASGAGDVTYKGNPAKKSISSSSATDVKRLN